MSCKRYRLNGASQNGAIGWKWLEPSCDKMIIPFGDILTNVHEDSHEQKYARIRKFLMNLSGYKYFYSFANQRVVIVHDSIIERYFDEIKE